MSGFIWELRFPRRNQTFFTPRFKMRCGNEKCKLYTHWRYGRERYCFKCFTGMRAAEEAMGTRFIGGRSREGVNVEEEK